MGMNSAKQAQVATALKNHYTPPGSAGAVVEGDALIDLLMTLPSLSTTDHVDTVLVQLQRHHKGVGLNDDDHALLLFVDDSITHVLGQTDLDFRIESYIWSLAPYMAVVALRKGVTALTRQQTITTLMDVLMRDCIGWSEDLGVLGEQFMSKVEGIVRPVILDRVEPAQGLEDLSALFAKETKIHKSLEERLCQSQLKFLAGQKARYFAAELLNKEMAGKKLPLFNIFMLQGSWFEFLQEVFVHHGQKSSQWAKATKLTRTLIWSLRPQKDAAKQNSIMSSLPGQIRSLCTELDFDTTQYEASLADVEGEFDAIRAGNPSDPCDFQLMEVDASMSDGQHDIDPDMKKQLKALSPGQWFLYDDTSKSEERIARIKLILNWNDTERLLFTNHNRRKVLHMTYGELAAHLNDGVVRALTPRSRAHEIIKARLNRVLQSVTLQKKKEKEVVEKSNRKVIAESYVAKRRAALQQSLKRQKQLAATKQKRARTLRQKAEQKLAAAKAAVAGLQQEAWVKLPIMEGTLTPCKLVAIIAANDKYIFANRAGTKVAEYTSGQLADMIVTENSEILDTGAEFAGAMASVVSGLREDRNKSYDELTGDVA